MAQKLKSMDIIKEIPIIMVTSVNQKMPFTFDKDSDGAFLPVEKFMEKPIEPHQLLHAVRELVKD
jgi:CheY-like chemotaxis protein